MLHGIFGRKLKRNKDQRRRLFMQLAREMFDHGRVKTTLAKAKAVQPLVEKLITKAKSASSADVREIKKTLSEKKAEDQLLDMAKTRFMKRTSGFTRIIKLGKRTGDSSEMVFMEFVDAAPAPVQTEKVEKSPVKTNAPATVQEAEVVEEEKPKKAAKTKKQPSKHV